MRDRIEDMVGKGMTLEQVKAARPTLDYDAVRSERSLGRLYEPQEKMARVDQ